MNCFLNEVLAAGDPIDVYAGIAEMISKEVNHVDLWNQVVRALGNLPSPLLVQKNESFTPLLPVLQALATAISMLAVSETFSVSFIEDLSLRCKEPGIRDVLKATLEEEEQQQQHNTFSWRYIEKFLACFPDTHLPSWQKVAQEALAPHLRFMEQILAQIPSKKKSWRPGRIQNELI